MAPADYRIAYPSGVSFDAERFITNFYDISDDPTKNEEWVSHFLIDGVLVMGPDTAYGPEGKLASPPTASGNITTWPNSHQLHRNPQAPGKDVGKGGGPQARTHQGA